MLIVPVQPVPSQVLTVQLANQPTRVEIDQKSTGLFCSVYVNDSLIIAGVVCEDANRIVRSDYLGFIGDFAFFDTQGSIDPYYTGLGSRWVLGYLEATDPPEAFAT